MVIGTETEAETELEEFTKSQHPETNSKSAESGRESISDTANTSEQEEKETRIFNKQGTANLIVPPYSPNLTITIIDLEHEAEDKRQMEKNATHIVENGSQRPEIDEKAEEREIFKPLLEQLPKMGEIW